MTVYVTVPELCSTIVPSRDGQEYDSEPCGRPMPCSEHERVQLPRFGEVLLAAGPDCDVEVVAMVHDFMCWRCLVDPNQVRYLRGPVALREHLAEHSRLGHRVPIERLKPHPRDLVATPNELAEAALLEFPDPLV